MSRPCRGLTMGGELFLGFRFAILPPLHPKLAKTRSCRGLVYGLIYTMTYFVLNNGPV